MNFKYLKTLLFEIKELASSQLLIVVILFVQVGIVTRGLGTTSYGQAVLVLALIAIIFRALHARNSDVTLLMLKKYGESMFTLSLIYDLLIGTVCYLICLVLFQSELNSLFGNYSMSFALNILLISRIFQTLSESSKAVLTFNGQFKKFALVDTVSSLLRFFTIAILFSVNPSIDNYFIGQAVFSIAYGFFGCFICRNYLRISEVSIKNLTDYFIKFKSDFLKQRLDQLVGIVPQHLDIVILGYFTDLSTVGIFRIAKRLVEPFTYIISVLTPLVQNQLSKESLRVNFSDLVKNFLLPISTIIIIPYVYFGENMINLISGSSFLDAYEPMLILVIGYIIYLNTFWIRQLLLFSNLIQYHAVSRLISLFVFVLASFFFVDQFAAVGIAIALSLSMIVQKFYEFYAFNKHSKQN
jgi:O-antigen/teichoic acid export membrane protein